VSWDKRPTRHMLTRTYTVHASEDQAERWEAAAAVQGRMVVGSWLSQTADAFLREMAGAGRPMPLAWYRGSFRVLVSDALVRVHATTEEIDVRGMVSGHFGIFRGDRRGPGGPACFRHSLVHIPSRHIIGTLRYQRACKALAAELLALRIDWAVSDPEKVVEGTPDQEKARALLRLFEKLTER
jgi:hypothetical protein